VLSGTPKTIRLSVFKMQHAPTHFLKIFPLRKTGPILFAGKNGFMQIFRQFSLLAADAFFLSGANFCIGFLFVGIGCSHIRMSV